MTTSHTGIARQLAPCAVTGLLIIAASASHAAAVASDNPGGTALTVGGIAFVLAVLVSVARCKKIDSVKARARVRVLLMGSAVWLGVVTATGMSWGAFQILAALVVSVSLHWWSAHRIPNGAMVVKVIGLDAYATLWSERVARQGKALVGSRLELPNVIDSGVQYTLRLVPGEHTGGTVEGERDKIRGALELARTDDLILEPHPNLPEPHLQMTIVTKPPVKGSVLWPGPNMTPDGRIALGPFADGIGTAYWVAHTDARVKGGFLQGGTNAGKSRMIESIGLSLAAANDYPSVIMFACGQGGASSRLLKENADHTALTLDAFRAMLRGLIRLGEHRQDENDVEGWDTFTATEERPAVYVIVDECHKFFIVDGETQTDIQAMAATIAREYGKVGIALILASQGFTLSSVFGGGAKFSGIIRSNILMGNGVMLRGKERSARSIFGVAADPTLFPDRPGYAVLAGTDPEVRHAPLLGYFVSNEIRDHWVSRVAWRSLDAGSANAWGADYINRKVKADADHEAKRARVEARKAGIPVPASARLTPAELPIARRLLANDASPFHVAQFPVWVNPTSTPGVSDAAQKVATAMVVGDVLRNGYAMPSWLARELGYSERHINTALNELLARGMVRKDGTQGHWYPTDKILSREVA